MKFLPHHPNPSQIQCRDCHEESETNFHVVGLKCPKCSSYNTVRCGNEEIPEDDGGAEGNGGNDMVMRILNHLLNLRAGQRQRGDGSESSDSEESGGEADEQLNVLAGNGSNHGSAANSATQSEDEEGGENQRSSGANSSASLPSLENEDGSYDGDHSDDSESESSESEEGGEAGFAQPFPFLLTHLINNFMGGQDSSGDEEDDHDGSWSQHHHSDWSDSDSTSSSVPNLLPDQSEDSWVTEEEEVIIGGVATEETTVDSNPALSNIDASDAHIRLDQNGVHSSAVDDSQDWETASEEVTVGGDADNVGREMVSDR